MIKRSLPIFLLLATILARGQMPLSEAASVVEVYKKVDGIDLKAWIFNPASIQPGDQRPAIVFFFGGGWRHGKPEQFLRHCEYLASRGMVAMTVDYRVLNRHGVKAKKCVADAKSAIRWVRQHAVRLGVDPAKIMAAGGSAGGHLAATTALIPGYDEPSDELTISAMPNALALFNPALVLANIEGTYQIPKARSEQLLDRMGADPRSLSPYHHVVEGTCPTIIFHGNADTTVDFKTAALFDQAMDQAGNQCRLVEYEGMGHGFFNYGRGNNGAYASTIGELDAFLVALAFLEDLPRHTER